MIHPPSLNWLRLVVLSLSILMTTYAHAEQQNTSEANDTLLTPVPMTVLSPPATRSPRETLFGFLDKAKQAEGIVYALEETTRHEKGLFHTQEHLAEGQHAEDLFKQAIRTLNLSDIPENYRDHIGVERALMLFEILKRIPLPPQNTVPTQAADETPSNIIQRWEIPGTEIAIELGQQHQYINEYVFSPETVTRIPDFYNRVKRLPILDTQKYQERNFYEYFTGTPGHLIPPKWSNWLPEWSKNKLYFDQAPWQWFALIVSLIAASSFIIYWLRWYISQHKNNTIQSRDLIIPIIIGGALWGESYLIETLFNITSETFLFIAFVVDTLLFIIASWFTYTAINLIAEKIVVAEGLNSRSIDASFLRTLLRIIAIIAAITVIYFGAQSLNIPIAPLLAGFGALGIAVGIGAQEYFKNVVGGLTIYMDRPFRVGEFCEFGNIAGEVEEIGLRSTRIRALDKTLIIIPNAHLSTANIINVSRMTNRVLKTHLKLRYETSREQIIAITHKINEYLSCEDWAGDNPIIRLETLSDFSIDILVQVNILTPKKVVFLEYQEKFLLKAMEIIKNEGGELAFPSQTLYINQDHAKHDGI